MPEGPEVKIMAERLNGLLRGKCLQNMEFISGPYKNNKGPIWERARERLKTLMTTIHKPNRALCFKNVSSKGKFIYFQLFHLERVRVGDKYKIQKKGELCFGSSLGLKGRWIDDGEPPHARFVLKYSDKPVSRDTKTIWYDDSMSQGKFTIETPEWLEKKLNDIGPDIYGDGDGFLAKMKTKKAQKMPIFEALMDQTLVSGIGNYLRAEILYNVSKKYQIDPFWLVSKLSDDQIKKLWKGIHNTAQFVYSQGGSQGYFRDSGKYQPRVYKRDITPAGEIVKQFKGKNNRIFYHV